ncbi:TetR family transcriptional regulator [Nocardia sp. CA2R105]|uniref:TetR/AcrR family transcriptional regulator n=1 Tax=Nocardia coffeae TaxID=2873381 RepID=UPI001CA6837F|nr:TetR/AcrR family transcriptional regulator [Nocardia coffeae]MBY8862292.1 TetR family transcriptional regulator [Nocardia coffeae]
MGGPRVSTKRRVGTQDSKTRQTLIETTTQIMLDEGYAAATSRRVAAKAGVQPALVHYYFPTMDDLFLAVFRRGAEANLKRQQEALLSDQPLRELWELSTRHSGTALMMEFTALANHRKDIRAEIASYAERFRELQHTALTFILRDHGIEPDDLPPMVLAILISSLAQTVVSEQSLGVTLGHPELISFLEQFASRVDSAGGGGGHD